MKTMLTLAILAIAAGADASETDGRIQMDTRIESTFRGTYACRTYLQDSTIRVESQGGFVTLTGSVPDECCKLLAAETAAGLPGVKGVVNRLEVRGGRPAERSDAWIRLKVNAALLFHRNVNAAGTGIEVKDGTVTLTGKAESEAQKALTAEYAGDVEGVRAVINGMTVTESPKRGPEAYVDDASITAQVKLTLLAHRSTSAIRTRVETRDGVVTLTGTARNAAEKDLVTRLVSDIHGVKSVQNDMVIE